MIAHWDINAPQTHRKEKVVRGGNRKEKSARSVIKIYIQANWALSAPDDLETTRSKFRFCQQSKLDFGLYCKLSLSRLFLILSLLSNSKLSKICKAILEYLVIFKYVAIIKWHLSLTLVSFFLLADILSVKLTS